MKIEIKRSNRRTLSLEVTADSRVIVRAPFSVSGQEIERFVRDREEWLLQSLEKAAERRQRKASYRSLTQAELEELAQRAAESFPQKVRYYARQAGVTYGRITIRHQRTRWGSCSATGNLNFNCLLMLAPDKVQDYVVVHELCHRKEMNHSKRFWQEVERIMPDYRVHKKWLHEHGEALMGMNR